jgi:hypothetical protein
MIYFDAGVLQVHYASIISFIRCTFAAENLSFGCQFKGWKSGSGLFDDYKSESFDRNSRTANQT